MSPVQRCLALPAVVAAAALIVASARGDERMVLGRRQFEADKSGKGAVLCTWSLYLSTRNLAAACGLPRAPTDDALDRAIAEIDDFILANSSLRPDRTALERFKRDAADSELARARQSGLDNACSNDMVKFLRSLPPAKIEASVKELLATPREPVMNPCL